jgi:hypothetical protein
MSTTKPRAQRLPQSTPSQSITGLAQSFNALPTIDATRQNEQHRQSLAKRRAQNWVRGKRNHNQNNGQ